MHKTVSDNMAFRILGLRVFEAFPTGFRRVTKKVAFFVSLMPLSKGMHGDHKPLPKSPNILSAGRTLHDFSAPHPLPSGVSATKGNFFGQGPERLGSDLDQMVTRRPSSDSPRRRLRRSIHDRDCAIDPRFMPMTGLDFPPAFF
ncbi:MAG: hypothetical protein HY579_12600 [Nitrospinae bacterium]|nr:hypothetical protein [Nitrospinota bacterium]